MGAHKGEALRAFVALDLDTISLRRVVRVAERLRIASGAPSASWTPPEMMHVTLQFVASLPVAAVDPVGRALAPLAEGTPAPPPSALRLDAFPSVADATVIVVELEDPAGAIAALAKEVEAILAAHGARREG